MTSSIDEKDTKSGLGESQPPVTPEPTLLFRNVCPTDLPLVAKLEKSSYPPNEAASRSQLQYRQHHAANFFRCVVLVDEQLEKVIDKTATRMAPGDAPMDSDQPAAPTYLPLSSEYTDNKNTVMSGNRNSLNGLGTILGFITATRCHEFTTEAMKAHDPTGPLLAIHSVVVDDKYRKRGIATRMLKNYIHVLKKLVEVGTLKYGIRKIVLISKMANVGLYLRCGFSVVGKSKIVHGEEEWYDCEMNVNLKGKIKIKHNSLRGRSGSGEFERRCPFWVLDSFAIVDQADGVAMDMGMGMGEVVALGKGTGNPAAVVMCKSDFDPELEDNVAWMQIVAREFNLSETAFIWRKRREGGNVNGHEYNIRYITCNGTEADLCGHATLAASYVVLQKNSETVSVVFYTKNNVALKAKSASADNNNKIVMEFPSKNVIALKEGTEGNLQALSLIQEALFPKMDMKELDSVINYIGVDEGGDDLLVEVTPEAFSLMPPPSEKERINFARMLEWDGYNRGIIVCCTRSSSDVEKTVDFHSRFFGPKAGIDEDPVTGSAHCVLAMYFSKKLDKTHLVGMQASARGGIVECTMISSDEDYVAVRIAGAINKAMTGDLYI